MRVRDAMGSAALTVRPGDTLADAARAMQERGVQGALVDTGGSEPGIVTSRDVLELVAGGHDPREARVEEHFTEQARSVSGDWPLERAAEAMVEGGFRHLVVTDGSRVVGVLTIRDILEQWLPERRRGPVVQIREAMNRDVLVVSRTETVAATAHRMTERGLGAAIVEPPRRRSPPALFTDRDALALVAAGEDPATASVSVHASPSMTFSAPDWSLKQAVEAMLGGDFQHVVVVEAAGLAGTIAMHDVLRRWTFPERSSLLGWSA